ncbi:MAG: hypothetical protein MHM6MM_008852, partial [Cercozoa sp. M6MM]
VVAGTPAIGFAGPGLALSLPKYARSRLPTLANQISSWNGDSPTHPEVERGTSADLLRALKRLTAAVVNSNDVVPLVGRQAGLVQQLSCASTSVLQCHSSIEYTCALLRSCGLAVTQHYTNSPRLANSREQILRFCGHSNAWSDKDSTRVGLG